MKNRDLHEGSQIHGFIITEIIALDELRALGISARHLKTGAQVFHIYNDDPENLFAFAFTTPSRDSTGVAHIIEHSVLCGSKNYPLKDAFIVLAQGSLQTFLNAMTFPDKTIYPAASINRHDYFNLMGVYGDAVFRPLLAEWTFLQEGWRVEATEAGPALVGVVYNEMKGAYSSMDSIAGDWVFRSLLRDTPYAFDSGGDPNEIPKLTWNEFKNYHSRHYVPANCRIFLCGDIPSVDQLAFLNERFLAELPAGEAVASPSKAKRWTAPRRQKAWYPGAMDAKATAIVAWLLGDSTDAVETLTLAALSEILLGHDGSPLARALVESGLGEDLAPASGLEGDLRETLFSVGLRGADAANAEKIEELVLDTLRRLAEEGIAKHDIDAALRSLDFANREIRRAGGPFSLSWLRRSLRGWLHGAKPYETLLFEPAMAELRRRVAETPRYFEGLVSRLLEEKHRVLLTVESDPKLAAAQAAAEEKTAVRILSEASETERLHLAEAAAELARVQSEMDSKEALAAIPHLARSDLERKVEKVPRTWSELGSTPLIFHDLFTKGIIYLDFAWPIDALEAEDYLYLPLYARAAVGSGLGTLDYAEVSRRLACSAGGFYAVTQTSSPAPGAATAVASPSGILDLTGRDWLVYRLKALEDRLPDALDLTKALMLQADFSDHRRLRDIIMELRNDLDSALAPGGHAVAASWAGRHFSRARAVDELWGGISQLHFAHRVAEAPIEEVASRLEALRRRINSSGLIVNCTADEASLSRIKPVLLDRFAEAGAPRPRGRTGADEAALRRLCGPESTTEVLASPSLQIGFGSLAMEAAPYASPRQAAELVLAHYASTGKLWETVRMKGGAYGAFAYPDGLEPVFFMSTYRDPDPVRSLDLCRAALDEFSQSAIADEELEKAIIGAYGKETRPRAPSDKGFSDFMRILYGIEDEARLRKLEAIIDVSAEELKAAAEALTAAPGKRVVLVGSADAEKAAKIYSVAAKKLPV